MSIGIGKKPSAFSHNFSVLMGEMSKVALIDALWCASQLGTDETPEQITAQACRNAVLALEARHDRIPKAIKAASEFAIESD